MTPSAPDQSQKQLWTVKMTEYKSGDYVHYTTTMLVCGDERI